jgi:uncharacterized phage infection (PIP) family protein YhgE
MTIKSFKVQDSLTVGSVGLKFAGSVADTSAKAAQLVQDANTKTGEIGSIQGQISSLEGQLSYWQGIASGNPQNPLYGQAQGWITQLNSQIASLADNLDVLIKEYQVIQENIDVVNETLANSVFRFPDATVQTTAYQKVTVPTHSYGITGDKEGMIAFDATYTYYCTADYVDNSTNIWKRTAHGAGTW